MGIYKADAEARLRLVLASVCLAASILVPSLLQLRKSGVLGLLVRFLRSFVLPVVVLRLTLSASQSAAGTALFLGLRGAVFLAERSVAGPPPEVGPDGRPKLRILLAGDSFFPKVDGVSTFSTHTVTSWSIGMPPVSSGSSHSKPTLPPVHLFGSFQSCEARIADGGVR